MDTSLIWEKVNGQGLVNFRNLMDSHFNFLYPQNNNPLSPSKNKSYHGQNLFDIGWMVNFRGYANFVYCRVTVKGETVKIFETFHGQICGQD